MTGALFGWEGVTAQLIREIAIAYVVCRVTMCLGRFLLSPSHSELRLVHTGDRTAQDLATWLRRITVTAAFGGAAAGAAQLLGLSQDGYQAVLKLVALAVDALLVTFVIRYRHPMAQYISPTNGARGAVVTIRNALSRSWHYIAVFFIVAIWLVGALGIRDGYTRLLHFFLLTAAVLIAARLAWIAAAGGIDRAFDHADHGDRSTLSVRVSHYYPVARKTTFVLIAMLTLLALLEVWGVGVTAWLRGQVGAHLVSAATDVAVAALVAIFVREGINAAMDTRLTSATNAGQHANAARLRTLFPMLRTVLFGAIMVIVGLTVLSAIGVNTAPLLAGAGILGIAIGFGSQKLVQDFINGIFLLLENEMQIGDWVSVAGLSVAVEDLSIRTLRLRSGDGAVHIIPFSSVTTVTNTNRGIGNAAVSVSVSSREDTDRVEETLKQIAAGMRADPVFQSMILADLELWGVDQLQGALVVVTGQIRCTDAGRWGVQREFNRRLKKRFEELGIELANPTQTVMLQRSGHAAPDRDRTYSDGAYDSHPGATPASPGFRRRPPESVMINSSVEGFKSADILVANGVNFHQPRQDTR